MPSTSTITSDEVNYLVYRYLQESGFVHSSFALAHESHLFHQNSNDINVPTGALITLLQKALMYIEVELHLNTDGSEKSCSEPFSLIFPHTCQEKRRKKKEDESMEVDVVTTSPPKIELVSHKLEGNESEVFVCAWNPSKPILATGAEDSAARLWDVSPGNYQLIQVLSHATEEKWKDVTGLKWNPSGSRLASGAYDGIVRVWDSEGNHIHTLKHHKGPIFALKWNPKGNYLLSGSVDKSVVVWDSYTGAVKQVYDYHKCKYHPFIVQHLAPTLDVDWKDDRIFASSSTDKMVYVCKVGDEQPFAAFRGHTDEVNTVKWDPSGNLLATCSDDCTAKIWSLSKDTWIYNITNHTKEIYTLEWSPTKSDPILATASFDTRIGIFDINQSKNLYMLSGHSEPVYSIAFSPDGKYLASGSYDKKLNIWSAKDGQLIHSHSCEGGIFEVAWDNSGQRIAVCTSSSVSSTFFNSDYQAYVFDIRV